MSIQVLCLYTWLKFSRQSSQQGADLFIEGPVSGLGAGGVSGPIGIRGRGEEGRGGYPAG